MRRFTAALALLFAAAALAEAQGQQAQQGQQGQRAASLYVRRAEQELIGQNAEWARAARAADARALDRLLADDFTMTNADGETLNKKQYIAELTSGVRKLTAVTPEGYQTRVHGSGAVLAHGGALAGEYKGRDMSGRYRWTHFFARRGRRWRCVATQVTRVTTPAPRPRTPARE